MGPYRLAYRNCKMNGVEPCAWLACAWLESTLATIAGGHPQSHPRTTAPGLRPNVKLKSRWVVRTACDVTTS